MCKLFKWKRSYKLGNVGICPGCLKLKRGMKPFDRNNDIEYFQNLCGDCATEASDIAYETLFSFLQSQTLNDIDKMGARWESLRDKFVPNYWQQVKRRLLKLRELRVALGDTFTADTIIEI